VDVKKFYNIGPWSSLTTPPDMKINVRRELSKPEIKEIFASFTF
jgi:hypothetical protein